MSLENIISKSIKDNNNPIGFDVFMDLALYHQEFGYYRSIKQSLGIGVTLLLLQKSQTFLVLVLQNNVNKYLMEETSWNLGLEAVFSLRRYFLNLEEWSHFQKNILLLS